MPSTSRAQQRLMAAAANNAQFPMARKLRASMTTQQLHDFASGSMAGKPIHASAPLHPEMQRQARMVADAHTHLARAIPGFSQLPARQRMVAVQEHVRTRKANGY